MQTIATLSQLRNRASIAPPETAQPAATTANSAAEKSSFLPATVKKSADVQQGAQGIAMTAAPNTVVQTTLDLPTAAEGGDVESDVIAPAAIIVPAAAGEEQRPGSSLLEFHGLKQQPFDVTPDPAYLYFSPSHREALASLRLGIEHLRGFMMLVADPGLGKTTLMNKLMEELSNSARVVSLFQTQCGSSELLAFILDELEVDHAGMDVVAMHRALNRALFENMLRGQRFVLIIDEAQNLQGPVLETVRLLSNFETTHSKLIQILLVGQPQLADTLMHRSLEQLRQRVAVLSTLRALRAREVPEYVEHRLRAAGWTGVQLFTPEALTQIAKSSEGVPRSINNLCFNALLIAFLRGKRIIDAELIQGVAGQLDLGALPRVPEESAVPARPPALPDRSTNAQRAAAPPAPASPSSPASGTGPSGSAERNGQAKPKPALSMAGSVTGKLNLGALPRVPEESAVPAQPLALADRTTNAQRAAAPAAPASPSSPASGTGPSGSAERNGQPKPKPALSVAGSVTEIVRSQNWDKKREYRVRVTFERDSFPGLSLADRYYWCTFYVGEEEAAKLYTGKRVKIKINQD